MNRKFHVRCAIAVLNAIVIGLPALAVETGTGTNQMANVYATNSINLQGSIITTWGVLTNGMVTVSTPVTNIAANAVTNTQIAASAVTGDKIAAGTISNANIAAGEVTGDKIAAGTISNVHIAVGEVTGDKLVTGTISNVNIAAGEVTGDKLVAGTISNVNLAESITISSLTVTNKQILAPIAAQSIAPGAAIAASSPFVPIKSSGGAVGASIAAGSVAGQTLILRGINSTDTVQITNNPPGVVLVGGVSFTMGTNDLLQLIYNGEGWVEVQRADNQ